MIVIGGLFSFASSAFVPLLRHFVHPGVYVHIVHFLQIVLRQYSVDRSPRRALLRRYTGDSVVQDIIVKILRQSICLCVLLRQVFCSFRQFRHDRSSKKSPFAVTLTVLLYRRRGARVFSKKLSAAILRICETENLTYEAASELCDISCRHFGSIARGQTEASMQMLEKICRGLSRTPDELLGYEEAATYRAARQVEEYAELQGGVTCAICPRCGACLDREYQAFYDSCGQKLAW